MNSLRSSLLVTVVFAFLPAFAQFQQTPLPYAFNALEPSIDAQTMEIHYTKHAAGYVANLNKAIKGTPAEKLTLTQMFATMSKLDPAIRNNGGGHFNHELFWTILSPEATEPSPGLLAAINSTFGAVDSLKKKLNEAGAKRFGSGWAWLSVTSEGKLVVSSTPNQDNPLMDVVDVKGIPILGIDVWEHAYYLKYQNKRGDYLGAIWKVMNWKEVSRRYEEALKR